MKRLSTMAASMWHFAMLLLVLTTVSLGAVAQEKTYFSIPKISADEALKIYAQQSQRQVLYPFDLVAQYESNAIEGYLNSDEALFELFRDTGLHASVDTKNNLVVRVATDEEIEMSNQKKASWGLVAALTSVFAAGTPAQESGGYGLEEITVTARKVQENMQDVPISVTAFSADTLERRQITGTDDIGKITPNLQFTNNAPLAGNNNSSVVFIRGVGQISPRANTDPGVGLYIDEVYMGQSVGGAMELRDIAGVQVLRGPQGALFGRNTIGGAVLLATAEPGDVFGGKFRLGTGDDGLVEVFGALDIPLSDTFKTRFSFGTKQQDGYVTRLFDGKDLGDTDNTTFTAKAVWDVTDNFTAKLNFDYTKADENGSALVFADYNNNTTIDAYHPTSPNWAGNAAWIGANQSVGAGCTSAWVASAGGPPFRPIETAPGTVLTVPPTVGGGGPPTGYVAEVDDPACANNFQDAGPFATNGTGAVDSSLENHGFSLNLDWTLNDVLSLKSITAYRELEWSGSRDGDNTPLTILETAYDSDGDQFSQEFQLTYQNDRMTAVAGAYYYAEEIVDILTPFVGDKPAGNFCTNGVDRCHTDSDNNITDNQASAIFGQITFDLTDSLSATLGVRRSEETKASTPEQFDWANSADGEGDASTVDDTQTAAQIAGTAPGHGDFYLEPRRYERDFSATTVSANLSYNFTETSMVYASYSEGFKGGGFNSTYNFPLFEDEVEDSQFDQEEVETMELGFKADLTDTLRVNGAIFSSDYKDLQFAYRVFIAPWLFNAGKASIDGGELEFTWIPSDNWILEGGFGLLDSSIDETTAISVGDGSREDAGLNPLAVNTSVAAGNQLPFAPEFQGNLGVGYNADLGSLLLSPRVDVSYSDRVFFDASNTTQIAQGDNYTTVDLSVALESLDSGWRLIVGINNATDEIYRVSGNSSLGSGTGYAEAAYARPQMWFANFTKEF